MGPAPLTTLPNAIGGTWSCGEVTFTSVQGNTADGKYLVAADKKTPDEPFGIVLIESATGHKIQITSPPAGMASEIRAIQRHQNMLQCWSSC